LRRPMQLNLVVLQVRRALLQRLMLRASLGSVVVVRGQRLLRWVRLLRVQMRCGVALRGGGFGSGGVGAVVGVRRVALRARGAGRRGGHPQRRWLRRVACVRRRRVVVVVVEG